MDFIYNIKDSSGFFTLSAIIDLLKAIVVLVCGWWAVERICNLVPVILKRSCSDLSIVSFLQSSLKVVLRTLLIVIVLGCLGLNISAILTTLGASVVAIGISIKDNISNIFSGVILVINKPIHVGDFIECEGFKGTVLRIETMFTVLQTDKQNCTVIVPNTKLISSIIKRESDFNISKVEHTFKIPSSVGSNEINRFFQKEFILNANILQMPLPKITVEGVEDGVSDIKIVVWCANLKINDVKTSLNEIVKKYLKKTGIKNFDS